VVVVVGTQHQEAEVEALAAEQRMETLVG